MALLELKQIPFFSGLNDAELALIKDCIKEKTFQKGESLFQVGNSCERVFFVRSGSIKMFRMSSSGREQVLETLGPGDTCACNPASEKWSCTSSAQALSSCVAWFLSRENYVKLVKTHPKLAYSLNELFAERLKCFSELIEEVSLKDSKKRLVKFLLDMMERDEKSKENNVLAISFTREEIAQRLGVARETIVRQLHQLKDKKLIEINPRQILIKDEKALRQILAVTT